MEPFIFVFICWREWLHATSCTHTIVQPFPGTMPDFLSVHACAGVRFPPACGWGGPIVLKGLWGSAKPWFWVTELSEGVGQIYKKGIFWCIGLYQTDTLPLRSKEQLVGPTL